MKKRRREITPKVEQPEKNELPDSDDEGGFSKWLKSNDGLENLKLFVVANSILIFLLISWPEVKEILEKAYYIGFFFLFVMFWYTVGILNLVNNYFKEELQKYLFNDTNLNVAKPTNANPSSSSSVIQMYMEKNNLLYWNALCYSKPTKVESMQTCTKPYFL